MLLLSLFLAAAPHGLLAKDNAELAAQLANAMPKWVAGKDLAAAWASKDEVKAALKAMDVSDDALAGMLDSVMRERKERSNATTFDTAVCLFSPGGAGKGTVVDLFTADGHHATIQLIPVKGRWALLGGVIVDEKALPKTAVDPEGYETFQKVDGAWKQVSLAAISPAPGKAPAKTGCAKRLSDLAKIVFVAEKSTFAEFDTYSKDFAKMGLVLERDQQVTVLEASATGFKAELKTAGAVAVMTEEGVEAMKVTTPCPAGK